MRLTYILIGLALAIFGAFIRVLDPAPLPQIREAYFDTLQKASPRAGGDYPVEIVAIDEASLDALGQWPWPRSVMAQLTDALNNAGAAVVAFDVLFAEPDRYSLSSLLKAHPNLSSEDLNADVERFDNDAAFADAMWAMPTVLATSLTNAGGVEAYDKAGFVTIGQPLADAAWPAEHLTGILPNLHDAAAGVGVINTNPTDDQGVVRSVPLFWQADGTLRPSLSLEALRVAMGEGTYVLTSSVDVPDVIEGVALGQFFFPTDSRGAFRLKYAPEDTSRYLSAKDILNTPSEVLSARVGGKIIFVGATAPGLFDIRTTALGQTVPGVSVHKQILEQAFAAEFLIRADYQAGIEVLIFLLLGVVVAVAVSMKRSAVTVIAGAGAAGVICLTSYIGYTQQGVLLDVTFPLFGGLLNLGLMGGYQFIIMDRDKRLLRRSFQHYVAPSVLDQIEASNQEIGLSGENKEITVMFADIRGFTSFSQDRDPQTVVSVLNDLFSRLTAQVLDTGGTVDKYLGDAVMAFWGAPITVDDHQTRGLRTALAFRETLAEFNDARVQQGEEPLALAVGFASGLACVGNIGSDQRFSYTAIGKTVNMAARIESACREIGYDIVTTAETAQASGLAWLPAGAVSLKGFSQPIALAIVVGGADMVQMPDFQSLVQLMPALLEGEAHPQALQEALRLATNVEPGLVGFLNTLAKR